MRHKFQEFVHSCSSSSLDFRLTPRADTSLYATCFAIYSLQLIRALHKIEDPKAMARHLQNGLRAIRPRDSKDRHAKPYRQLLTFGLSALAILDELKNDPLEDLVGEQIDDNIRDSLLRAGVIDGRAGSGNQAMFSAIFMIHARDHLGMPVHAKLDEWVDIHVKHMNRFGFWGSPSGMTHLQFQNGYHQHEVLEYLGIDNPHLEQTLSAVSGLADAEGHFAPYPGGGGCYDYDAVFMLTPDGHIPNESTFQLLAGTASSIVAEQNQDGGFAESIRVRPRSLAGLRMFASHAMDALGNRALFSERLRYGLTLQRSKHNRIHTHWSQYSREWNESDLWDSWFRMLALARIDVAMHPEHAGHWGFIDYPGIGYHPSLRSGKVER